MSFFPIPEKVSKQTAAKADIKMLHTLECQACPLSQIKGNKHPDMPATGVSNPMVYALGEAPGKDEDIRGRQFVGKSGQLLRDLLIDIIGTDYKNYFRWNNTVRTRPIDNATPTWQSIECCRPSIVRDIEQSKPKAIFGFGNIPLSWLTGYSGIYAYRGRCMPVKVGTHVCWYFPMLHPAAILHGVKGYDPDDDDDGSDYNQSDREFINEDHRILKFDLIKALALLDKLGPPMIHSADDALSGIDVMDKCDDQALDVIEEQLKLYGSKVVIGIDYETDALRPYNPDRRILTAAVSDGLGAITIPFDHPEASWTPKQRERLDRIWINFLTTATAIKAVHNLQFELEWTGHRFAGDLLKAGRWECTMVQASIIDHRYKGTKPSPLSLEFLVLQHFGFNLKKLAAVERHNLINTPLPHVLQYNGLDAKYHALLFKRQHSIIRNENLLVAYKLASRRVPTLVMSQLKGIPVSQKQVEVLHAKYADRIETTSKQIAVNRTVKRFKKEYKFDFDPGKHCVKLFHDMLQRKECEVFDKKKRDAKTWWVGDKKVNKISCDEDVLKQIGGELPELIIRLRKAQKRMGTYILPMREGSGILWPGSYLHPVYNHTFTDTGRLSAEEPNVQNYPKRDGEAKEVRKGIVARKGRVIVAIDYGQIEARVIAMYTKDKTFVKALWEDYDVHMEWAERVAYAMPGLVGGKQYLKDKPTMKKFRTGIKNEWTFPLFFGATLESVCTYLTEGNDHDCKVEPGQLKKVHADFWKQFGGVKEWQETLRDFYEEHGYVETFTGRRRHGPMSFNKLINAPVQGFTAELVMDGMCRLSETNDPLLPPEIQIHDDLTWVSVPENRVDELADKALDVLLNPPAPFIEHVNVPITMELSVGKNWLEMTDIGVFKSNEWKQ
jgi:uracil-DNA glycosylase family 4